ncbi:MAG: hypothetical protein PHR84_06300 [Candidatus Omnitrophica bacterium]|nr:hypothetical protein [Candidatus Omnitrophota bacterium]MDD5661420.1 hypothetical protein [Candidatus Omnitrophota bacterium]
MGKKIFRKKFWAAMFLSFLFISLSTNAFAAGARHGGGRNPQYRREAATNHRRYYYQQGRFYRPGWFWFKVAVTPPPIGAIVAVLPFGHRAIIVGGFTYYNYDNLYYRACPRGYIVVAAPV